MKGSCIFLLMLLLLLVVCQSFDFMKSPLPPPPPPIHNHHHHHRDDVIQYEVIGSSGRIGSQFMRLLGSQALALPRGVCPGSSTSRNNSSRDIGILVCTPSSAWNSIYQQTLPERRGDLVLCGNGLLDGLNLTAWMNNEVTQVIPHYSVETVGGPARVETTAPPTFIYGKYARQLRDCLRRGVLSNVEILESAAELRVKALQKLLWSSCLWLLCHVQRQHPLTVGQVYEEHVEILVALVHELWPQFQSLLTASAHGSNNNNNSNTYNITMTETLQYLQDYSLSIPDAIPSWELAMEELKDRNRLLAAPRQPLHRTLLEQVAGSQAVAVVFDETTTDDDDDEDTTTTKINTKEPATGSSSTTTTLDLRDTAGIAVYGNVQNPTTIHHHHETRLDPQPQAKGSKSIVVIGSGILGASVAYHLALFQQQQQQQQQLDRTKCKITVVSEQSDIADATPTTRASWAWINANQKYPLSYQHLNSLGMHAWRNHALLRHLPTWQGSLVQQQLPNDNPAPQLSHNHNNNGGRAGYYAHPSPPRPLSKDEWRALEPNVEFVMPTPMQQRRVNGGQPSTIYSFPNEGCVDPIQALQTLRKAAAKLGVDFVWNQNVTRLIESNSGADDNGNNDDGGDTNVIGVECFSINPNDETFTETVDASAAASPLLSTRQRNTIAADMVVVTAGTGSEKLTGIPMKHSWGGIASIQQPQPTPPSGQFPVTLSKIVVDAVGKSHVLQRRDGSIVAGGGDLEFGGSTSSMSIEKTAAFPFLQRAGDIDEAARDALWSGAIAMVPALSIDNDDTSKTLSRRSTSFAFANRPIPQDGFPVVGFVRPGVYTVVTHSGVTLAPLLGPLAAQEILASVVDDGRNAIDLELLAPYRPTRFPKEQSSHEENGFLKMLDEKIKTSTFQLSLFASWVRK